MSAKALRHERELHFQEVPAESLKPGNVVCGMGGHLFQVRETLPTDGALFVEFENAPTLRILNGGKMMLRGAQIL